MSTLVPVVRKWAPLSEVTRQLGGVGSVVVMLGNSIVGGLLVPLITRASSRWLRGSSSMLDLSAGGKGVYDGMMIAF